MLVRLEHARVLLRQTTIHVAEIAFAAGFAAPMHFSRMYQRHVGMTACRERKPLPEFE
jgi:transcriptional regulator GlxA family with amidase domain